MMMMRKIVLQITRLLGAVVAYGCLAAFVALVSVQLYGWFRDKEWTHIGTSDGMRVVLAHCCLRDGTGAGGRLAALAHWLDTPVDWLGLHKVLEVVPASLTLFAISIFANCIFIYSRDRIDEFKHSS